MSRSYQFIFGVSRGNGNFQLAKRHCKPEHQKIRFNSQGSVYLESRMPWKIHLFQVMFSSQAL